MAMAAQPLDYEEYGNSFRTPAAAMPTGGSQNNGTTLKPQAAPGGRPSVPSPDDELARAKRGLGAAGDTEQPQAPQPQQTFREMQAAGVARPPMPTPVATMPGVQMNPANPGDPFGYGIGGTASAPTRSGLSALAGTHIQPMTAPPTPQSPLSQMQQQFQGANIDYGFTPQQQFSPTQGGGLEDQLQQAYQNYQGPGAFAGSAQRYGTPAAYVGQQFNGQAQQYSAPDAGQQQQFNGSAARTALPTAYQGQGFNGQYNAYQGPQTSMTGQFQAPGSGARVDQATEQSVLQGLANPSRWDNSLINSSYNQLAGGIDDDYNARDQALTGSMASRGLGAVGDTTIGANDARYQNLQRRTAKSDALQSIMENAANTQASDRAQAISAGLGYGGQQFNQGLQGYNANAQTNQQNFGQNLAAAQFGAGEQQNAYDRSLQANQYNTALGQQNYQNQLGQAQYNQGLNQQDYQNQAANAQFNNQATQQNYQNQFANTQFNQNAAQQQYQNQFANAGYNNQVGQQGYENQFNNAQYNQGLNQQDYANQANNYQLSNAAGQQGFNNKQQLLNNYLGYGQQGFQNQLATHQQQQQDQQQQYQNLLAMLGY